MIRVIIRAVIKASRIVLQKIEGSQNLLRKWDLKGS